MMGAERRYEGWLRPSVRSLRRVEDLEGALMAAIGEAGRLTTRAAWSRAFAAVAASHPDDGLGTPVLSGKRTLPPAMAAEVKAAIRLMGFHHELDLAWAKKHSGERHSARRRPCCEGNGCGVDGHLDIAATVLRMSDELGVSVEAFGSGEGQDRALTILKRPERRKERPARWHDAIAYRVATVRDLGALARAATAAEAAGRFKIDVIVAGVTRRDASADGSSAHVKLRNTRTFHRDPAMDAALRGCFVAKAWDLCARHTVSADDGTAWVDAIVTRAGTQATGYVRRRGGRITYHRAEIGGEEDHQAAAERLSLAAECESAEGFRLGPPQACDRDDRGFPRAEPWIVDEVPLLEAAGPAARTLFAMRFDRICRRMETAATIAFERRSQGFELTLRSAFISDRVSPDIIARSRARPTKRLEGLWKVWRHAKPRRMAEACARVAVFAGMARGDPIWERAHEAWSAGAGDDDTLAILAEEASGWPATESVVSFMKACTTVAQFYGARNHGYRMKFTRDDRPRVLEAACLLSVTRPSAALPSPDELEGLLPRMNAVMRSGRQYADPILFRRAHDACLSKDGGLPESAEPYPRSLETVAGAMSSFKHFARRLRLGDRTIDELRDAAAFPEGRSWEDLLKACEEFREREKDINKGRDDLVSALQERARRRDPDWRMKGPRGFPVPSAETRAWRGGPGRDAPRDVAEERP